MSAVVLSSVQATLRMAPPAKRPKLSLDTASPSSIFGRSKHSNSLRLETLSATSPTARNTFGNSATSQKSIIERPIHASPLQLQIDDTSALRLTPLSTASSTPYDVSIQIGSILRNGPAYQPGRRRKSSLRSSPRSRSTSPAKKVVFRAPLTETIKNTVFIFAHSDIEPLTPTTTPSLSTLTIPSSTSDDAQLLESKVYVAPPKKLRVRLASDICPATPVAGRAKERQWQWTLGPIDTSITAPETAHTSLDSPSLMTVDVN